MAALLASPLCSGPATRLRGGVRKALYSWRRPVVMHAIFLGGEGARRNVQCRAQLRSVEIEHNGTKHVLQVAEDESILSKALDAGLEVPYDCRLGVCMTCPAKLEQGEVDQSEGMLSDDVIEQGYTLMCVAYPRSDCKIRTIPEDELLSLQLVTAAD
eukprot:TRINITY_DN13328_c0_g1_i1.p1 TRINITY_DN13328_c0_g1~~TRINITY_DN13328_c0_g1_i1.p1  ORF type:complete len:157 (+),score=12.16 TRINITY_DN13328_c0_g1_i1:67-537(+)